MSGRGRSYGRKPLSDGVRSSGSVEVRRPPFRFIDAEKARIEACEGFSGIDVNGAACTVLFGEISGRYRGFDSPRCGAIRRLLQDFCRICGIRRASTGFLPAFMDPTGGFLYLWPYASSFGGLVEGVDADDLNPYVCIRSMAKIHRSRASCIADLSMTEST
ncbi:hypothetical protein KFK09_006817 [Dendrobium nobile]|uniref:Uncharacterized protein n=1 Tax=Dendrobium nobile TaxID=94219 RepID=A0A8T3BUN0_DENNO|nr:hypothetical protein KFK09_006817 [Dendrobium nobile]